MENIVFYKGPSLLTGAPIVAILTGLRRAARNTKTGNMLQTYILRSDMTPNEAIVSGGDDAICGDCSLRSATGAIGRACYVNWWQAPSRVHHALYRHEGVTSPEAGKLARGRYVRVGTYGDPAAIPFIIWRDLLEHVSGWTGYTHQWRTCDRAFRGILMASVDTPAEQLEAVRRGWRTFRARAEHEQVGVGEVRCPASSEMGHALTCRECEMCRGGAVLRPNVTIIAHGPRAKWINLRVVH